MLSRGTLDRAAHLRTDDAAISTLWSADSTRVLTLDGPRLPVDAQGALVLVPSSHVTDGWERHFLGLDDSGHAVFVARAANPSETEPDEPPPGASWLGLREAGSRLDARDAGIAVTAVALHNWHSGHPFCARCGAPTKPATAGWVRRCTVDASEHYPRIDGAVIMLVRDDRDRALLGRNAQWPEGWFSTLAGFVEPGETLEAAVRREVHEETGVVIGTGAHDVIYLGSQPWPFPSSLMMGFDALATGTEITVDEKEMREARWFTRAELMAACEDGSVSIPPTVSIARRLIERWYGGPLPQEWARP